VVSKAFQVLSDPQKRQIFDQTGSDPESRGGGAGGGGSEGAPFTGFGGASHHGGPDLSPEDFFNLFFSNGGGLFGNGGGIFDEGRGFTFGGGPGIRVHQFGTGPRMQRRTTNRHANNERQEEADEPVTNLTRIFWQLLPLILFFLVPILSGLFSGDGEQKLRGPHFAMDPQPPYTQMRVTPEHKIPFYVNPKDLEGLAMRDVTNLGKRAEAAIVNTFSAGCSREELMKQQMLQEAQGFFFTDQDKLKRAREMSMPNCRKLQELGVPMRRY